MQRLQGEDQPSRKRQFPWKRLIIFICVIVSILLAGTILILSSLGIFSTIWTTITSIIISLIAILIALLTVFFPDPASRPTAIDVPSSSQQSSGSNEESKEVNEHLQVKPDIKVSDKIKTKESTSVANVNDKTTSFARSEQRQQFNLEYQQTYVTLVIALEVLAFGVLLFAFTETGNIANAFQSYFYVPHFASLLILLTILSTINLKIWRFSVLQIALLHILAIFEIIAFRFFNNLLYWLFCIGFVLIIQGLIQFINSIYKNRDINFDRSKNISILTKSISLKIMLYPIIGVIFLLLVLFYSVIRNSYYFNSYSFTIDIFITCILLIILLLILENTSFQLFRRSNKKEVSTPLPDSGKEMSNSSVIHLRILEEPLTAYNLTTIITSLTELNTKCWLIQQSRFGDLIEFTQTHDARLIEEANLVVTKISYNSPAEIEFQTNAEPDPQDRTGALKTAIIEQFTPVKEKIAVLDNHAREIEKKLEEIKTHHVPSDKVQRRHPEAQNTQLEDLVNRLETERQQHSLELELLEIERQRLEIQEKRLDIEKKRVDYALEIADKMINLLHPNVPQEAREVLLRTLLPNLLQMGNGKGAELVLPTTMEGQTTLEENK